MIASENRIPDETVSGDVVLTMCKSIRDDTWSSVVSMGPNGGGVTDFDVVVEVYSVEWSSYGTSVSVSAVGASGIWSLGLGVIYSG